MRWPSGGPGTATSSSPALAMARCGSGTRSPATRPATPLADHDGPVRAVAIGRAGDRDVIVSGSDDGTVRVWDAVTGDPAGDPLADHDGPVSAVAIGRAGDRDVIVSGSDDGTVQVWDAVTGDPAGDSLAGHDGPVNAVAIGRAGDRDVIVSGSDDGTVRGLGCGYRRSGRRTAGRTRRPGECGGHRAGRGPGRHRLRLRRSHSIDASASPAPAGTASVNNAQ